jgi:hypothetical protein
MKPLQEEKSKYFKSVAICRMRDIIKADTL